MPVRATERAKPHATSRRWDRIRRTESSRSASPARATSRRSAAGMRPASFSMSSSRSVSPVPKRDRHERGNARTSQRRRAMASTRSGDAGHRTATPEAPSALVDEDFEAAQPEGYTVSASSVTLAGVSLQCASYSRVGTTGQHVSGKECWTARGVPGYVAPTAQDETVSMTSYSSHPAPLLFQPPAGATVPPTIPDA